MQRGQTSKPCEGCGSTTGRPIGKLCRSCRETLERARLADERIAEFVATTGQWEKARVLPAWQSFYEGAMCDAPAASPYGEPHRVLGEAMRCLTQLVSRECVDTAPLLWEARKRLPCLPVRRPEYVDSDAVREFPPHVVDALAWLDACIRAGLQLAHEAGVEKGKGALLALAEGRMTSAAFDALRR